MIIQELLEAAGYETQSYSGRGMGGRRCLATVTDNDPSRVAADMLRAAIEGGSRPHTLGQLADALDEMRTDSMGKQAVLYFPSVAFGGGEAMSTRQPIGRAEFLYARMAYLASMRDDGDSPAEMIRACNIGDPGQVMLLLMTWDDSAQLPGENL